MKVNPSLAALQASISERPLRAGRRDRGRRHGKEHSHIQDTIRDDLSVDIDAVCALGQAEDDGIGGPQAAHQHFSLDVARKAYRKVIMDKSVNNPLVFRGRKPAAFLLAHLRPVRHCICTL